MPRRHTLKPHPWELSQRMLQHGAAILPLALASLGLGMAIYHWAAGLSWADSFLNAAMLLGGMGPVDRITTTAGKWLAGVYALFAGIVFLVDRRDDAGPGHSPCAAPLPARDRG